MSFRFQHHIIDRDLEGSSYAQTALVDLDGDGRLEYVTGRSLGDIYWYKYHSPGRWSRHLLGTESPADVGACAIDVDGDGNIDLVTGGAWYRNSQDESRPFERIVFDPDLAKVHDVVAADIDGDGRLEVVTMSDQNTLRWYRIPDDPTKPWIRTDIGPPVHSGATVGDIDGDGHADVVRTDVWFRNVKGDGTEWESVPIGPNTPPPDDFQPYFAFDATKAIVSDVDRDGRNDIVFTDAEIPGGKVWWMKNTNGDGRTWERIEVAGGGPPRRGPYHSLCIGDLDGDGDVDIMSCEMEGIRGEAGPRWYIWENIDGKGADWREHVILDANLGGHEAVVGDVTGNGRLDVIAKPWHAAEDNAVGGDMFVLFLENISE
jgi:hypothetical protein